MRCVFAQKVCSSRNSINIRIILRQNSYPESIIDKGISNKLARFQSLPKFGPNKCPVYLKLPWIGNISLKFENKINSSVKHCFRAVELRVFYSTRKILPSIHKDAVPFIQQSMVVYEYVCRCDCRYMGRTSLRLEERIKQHVSNFIRKKQQPTKILSERKCKIRSVATHQQCVSAIGLHLMQNPECATQYSNDQFSILAKARSIFHLSVLKATYIKISKPILCLQKEFVYSLQIFH